MIRGVVLFGFLGSAVCLRAQCPSDEGKDTPDQILQHASPFNWTLLSLGGPTDVTLTGNSVVTSQAAVTNIAAEIGIAAPGTVMLDGSSRLDGDVYLTQSAVRLTQYGASYHGPITESVDSDNLLSKARQDALNGAYCASNLTPTLPSPGSINITDASGTMTINADAAYNVLIVRDLILSNGNLVLSSTFTGLPNVPAPTLVINISGTFKLSGASKIVLAGTLDEIHVLFNVIGTGDDVAFSGGMDSTGIPTSQISGVLLAPLRNIDLSPGLVNGTVIGGGRRLNLTSGVIVSHLQFDPDWSDWTYGYAAHYRQRKH